MKYYNRIKEKADEGKVAEYYTFWVIVTLVIGTIIITPLYLYYPTDSLIGKMIFVLLFVTISLTNFQALFVAIDYAKRSEPYADVWRKGAIFMGTIMNRLEEQENQLAKKENRSPRTTEEVATQFANMLIIGMQSVEPLVAEVRAKGVTIKKVVGIAHNVIEYSDDIEKWIKRMEKLMPIFDALASSVENVDQKEIGKIIGRKIAESIAEEIKKSKGYENNGNNYESKRIGKE